MLFIQAEDLRRNFTIEDFLDAAEEAFQIQASGEFSLPDRLSYPQKNGIYNVMPCFTPRYISNKLLTTYPINQSRGLPTINGVVLLADAELGLPLAMIDGPYLTGIRTGAMGGISSKYLAPENASSLAVIGAGVQGIWQTLSVAAIRPIRDVYVYARHPEGREAFQRQMAEMNPDLSVHLCQSGEEAAGQGEILITCTTSPEPVLPNDPALFRGKHIMAIGTFEPTKRELPPAAIETADEIYVDTMFACQESGDMAIPLAQGELRPEQVQEFAQKVCQGLPRPFRRAETTLYKSVGLGLFDLVAAGHIYEKALREHIGVCV